jgi:hypothetical protein
VPAGHVDLDRYGPIVVSHHPDNRHAEYQFRGETSGERHVRSRLVSVNRE